MPVSIVTIARNKVSVFNVRLSGNSSTAEAVDYVIRSAKISSHMNVLL